MVEKEFLACMLFYTFQLDVCYRKWHIFLGVRESTGVSLHSEVLAPVVANFPFNPVLLSAESSKQ